MRLGRRLWVMLAAGLCLTACVDLNAPPPKIRKAPAEQAEKDSGVFAVGGHTSVDFPRSDGTTVLSASGQISALMGATGGTGDLLDVTADSKLPEYQARIAAGRVRYQIGRQVLVIDHRFDVRSPQRRATLRAERGELDTEKLEFQVAGRARLTHDGTLLFADNARVKLDLRSASGANFWVRRSDERGTWTARAEQGELADAGTIVLAKVSGDLAAGGKPVQFEAPRAAWHAKAGQLNFENGVTITVDGGRLHAEAATYEAAARRVVTRGATTITRDNLTLTGTRGAVDLVAREARLYDIDATLGSDHLRATSGSIAENRTLRLTGVQATLAGETSLQAANATYRDGDVTASGGVKVRSTDGTLTAGSAAASRGGDITASGRVRLQRGSLWASGDRLTADRKLTRATLRPMRAGGTSDEGAWSLNAGSGSFAKGEGISLESASGVFRGGGRRAEGHAGRAKLSADGQTVTLSDGLRLSSSSDNLTVTAQSGTYLPGEKVFRLTGNVHAEVRGATVSGKTWIYRLGRGDDEPVVETGR